MQEHHLSVTRTARYVTLSPSEAVREVWFVLHGYGQLAAFFIRQFRILEDGHRLIVAPEALSRFYLEDHRRVGASWMTREDRGCEINDYVAYLDALYDHVFGEIDRTSVSVHVLGFSQGAATASRWTVLGRAEADRLILWAGELAHDLDLDQHAAALSRLSLTIVAGNRDTWLTPERLAAQQEIFERHGIPYRLVPFDGGHRLDDDVLASLTAP